MFFLGQFLESADNFLSHLKICFGDIRIRCRYYYWDTVIRAFSDPDFQWYLKHCAALIRNRLVNTGAKEIITTYWRMAKLNYKCNNPLILINYIAL